MKFIKIFEDWKTLSGVTLDYNDNPTQTHKELEFLNIKFDFEIDPDHFIQWLGVEFGDISGNYAYDVTSMCEYSVLYMGMMLYGKKLKNIPKIYYGKFGIPNLGHWEHYWLGYMWEEKEYFIDLTLKQFLKDAPKLAISEALNDRSTGHYSYLSIGSDINKYVKRQKAFKYYTNPHTMIRPTKYEDKMKSLINPNGFEYLTKNNIKL